MANSPIRALGAIPGATGLRTILTDFADKGEGVVTAIGDGQMQICAELLGVEGVIEVISFSDVVRRYMALCHEEVRPTVRTGHYVAALAQACSELELESPFYRVRSYPGFHRALARTLRELHGWSVGAAELLSACELASPRLSDKLRSLASLESAAIRTLGELGREMTHDNVLRGLDCKPPAGTKLGRLLFYTGSCGEPLIAQWILWAAGAGADVTVVMDVPAGDQDLFAGSARMAQMLGVTPSKPSHSAEIAKVLFTVEWESAHGTITISSCADSLAEAEWALRGCLQDIQGGTGQHQIGILARDLDTYAPLLEAAAKRLNLRLRMPRRAPLLTNRFARLALETLEFCASPDVRRWSAVLKSTYLGLDREQSGILCEALKEAYRAKGNAWPVLLGWSEAHREEFPWFHKLMQWRDEAARSSHSLSGWSERLRLLIDILPWQGSDAADQASRARDLRAQTVMQRSIAQVASLDRVRGGEAISLSAFVTTCRRLWEDEDTSLPVNEGGIYVTASAECLPELKSMYVLGMLEGVFPRRRSEDPILTDSERRELSELLHLEPPLENSVDRARQERDEFYRVCTSAPSLAFSYPQTDESRDNVPAFYLEEISRAVTEVHRIDRPRTKLTPDVEDCLAVNDRALATSMQSPREEPLPVLLESEAAIETLAWPEDQGFTPKQLRDALQCPFRFFARRRLDLYSNRPYSRWGLLRQLPQHVRLMHQPTPDVATLALLSALDAELDKAYADIPAWELALMRSGGQRLIKQWVAREFRSREVWQREADSVRPDIPFGAPGLRNLMPGDVSLIGFVAGLSRLGSYNVVHLYESRPPQKGGPFGETLSEIDTLYYGLHLLARWERERATAIEVETMSGDRTLMLLPRTAGHTPTGRVQEGLQVIDLGADDDPVRAVKGFHDQVKLKLGVAVRRIREMNIQPIQGDHCSWCDYGELCRRSRDYGEDVSPFGVDVGLDD